MTVILDASALLAPLRDDPGADEGEKAPALTADRAWASIAEAVGTEI